MAPHNELELVTRVIIDHGTLAGGRCVCGYVHPLGASIAMHKALHVIAALELFRSGASFEQSLSASVGAVQMSGLEAS